jgi:hypothetical protein
MTLARAAALLEKHFDTLDTAAGIGEKDGRIGRADLEAMASGKNPGAPAELVEACKWLLENPGLLNALDTAAGIGEADGIIGKVDTQAAVRKYSQLDDSKFDPKEPMTLGRAATIVKKYFDIIDTAAGIDKRDGIIGKADLEAIAASPGAPADLKAACKFLLDNPAFFDDLETAAGVGRKDGRIGMIDLDAIIANRQEEAVGPRRKEEPMTLARASMLVDKHFDILDTAAGLGEKDGIVGRPDLEAIAKGANPGASAELVEACKWLLDNPAMFNALDMAAGIGGADGKIGRVDTRAAVQKYSALDPSAQAEGEMSLGRAAALLLQYFDMVDIAAGLGSPDGILGRPDFEAVVQSPGAPADLRAACQFLLDNPAMLANLDTAAGVGERDGRIGRIDLEAAVDKAQDEAVGPRGEQA